jgi:hypothetical protein
VAKDSLSTGFTGDVTPETGAAAMTRSAMHRAKDEAGMVVAHAIDHPTATGSAFALVGLIGLTLGYMIGVSASRRNRDYY